VIRRFARPYAHAILDVVKSTDAAAALRDELARFEETRASAADLGALYANPGIDVGAKLDITRTIAKRLGLSEMAVKLLEILIRNYRINDLASIVDAVSQMIRQQTGTVLAEVRAAHQPSPSEIEDLRKSLETKFARKVDMEVSVDPALIGGFVARVGSEIYDASVSGKIHKFRESLG
jgi:F-type H+-transporting ATPase subunit delta